MIPTFIGRVVEWDDAKGCGWIDTDGQRIFLHRRDFADRRKRIEVGDRVRFTAGLGPTGRTCARGAIHLNDGGRFGMVALLLLTALLAVPALAVAKLPIDLRAVGVYAVAISGVAYAAYARDKAQARATGQRIPEATLHLLELLGGWPGAFIAQRRWRHKSSKRAYQLAFWAIVSLYQLTALDSLQQWRFSRALWNTILTRAAGLSE
jgi:uncharacterized membrane protein YsdA (DUF1294 family)/cold shock CspA family protein